MNTEDKIIFPERKTKKLSTKKSGIVIEPYEQQKQLMNILEAWCFHAIDKLKESGYKGFVNYFPPSNLAWRPQALPLEVSAEVRNADTVLRAIHNLREAISQGDQNRVANAGIQLGIAASIAHVEPYENFAVTGKKVTDGHLSRDSTDRKDTFQEWLRENHDKIKDIRNLPKLMELEKFIVLSKHVKPQTIRGWLKEVYPDHLKTGAPIKNK